MTIRENIPGDCLSNALREAGYQINLGEWPLIKDAVPVLKQHGIVAVNKGDFTFTHGEYAIIVYGDKIDEDGVVIGHAVLTNAIQRFVDNEQIWMIAFIDRSMDNEHDGR